MVPPDSIGEVREPIPAAAGRLERYDCEYRRNGTANLFIFLDAHRPSGAGKVTDRRTAPDFAERMRDLVDVHYPHAETIRVVLDNLSTHSPGALQRLEFHHTPKHASWLNMLEIRIGVLRGKCLNHRIADRDNTDRRNRRLGTTAQRRRRPDQMDVLNRT